ncbi:hypothetical protein [Lysobacter gummosus]|uniref:hypothetical protein n=1 Tax=Lysobacter gummosus TaxID=262324 RepID=UPI003629A9AA
MDTTATAANGNRIGHCHRAAPCTAPETPRLASRPAVRNACKVLSTSLSDRPQFCTLRLSPCSVKR